MDLRQVKDQSRFTELKANSSVDACWAGGHPMNFQGQPEAFCRMDTICSMLMFYQILLLDFVVVKWKYFFGKPRSDKQYASWKFCQKVKILIGLTLGQCIPFPIFSFKIFIAPSGFLDINLLLAWLLLPISFRMKWGKGHCTTGSYK